MLTGSTRQELVYFDNAATTQKPQVVLDALAKYYSEDNANVHRGVHQLSDAATHAFESARDVVASGINARHRHEVIWTRGTTESINLVATCLGQKVLKPGRKIILSTLEHHSNIVPWQVVAERTGATIEVVRILDSGALDVQHLLELLEDSVEIVAVTHTSNALGVSTPLKEVVDSIHSVGAVLVVDGAQAMSHDRVDVQALNCDFFAFSGHKMFGPTGIGVLYGKAELLDSMPPYQTGGEMIEHVSFEKTTYQQLPFKFEAGTPHIAGAVGLAAAFRYLEGLDQQGLASHERDLLAYATSGLQQIEGLRIVGTEPKHKPLISFNLDGIHPHDIGTLLDHQDVEVRTGHHCAMPLMKVLKIDGTVRASLAMYNTKAEIDRLVAGVQKAQHMLS